MRELVLAATMVVMVAHLQGAAVGEGGAGSSSSSFSSVSANSSSQVGTVEEGKVAPLKPNKSENEPDKIKPKESEASAETPAPKIETVSVGAKTEDEKKTTSLPKDLEVEEDELVKDEAMKSEEIEEIEPDAKKPAAESLVDDQEEKKDADGKEPEPDTPEEAGTVAEMDEGANLADDSLAEEPKATPQIEERPGGYSEHESSGEEQVHSHFMSYFMVLAVTTIIAYLVFHNKKKILGLIVEGRSGRQAGRRRQGGREYRKLDSNVEDMMETGRETSMRQVIY